MRLAFLVSKWPRRMVLIERCDLKERGADSQIDPSKNLSHIPNGITSAGTGPTCLGIYAT
jgi:hypothetical protein